MSRHAEFLKENLWVWATAVVVYLTLSGWIRSFVGWLSIGIVALQIVLHVIGSEEEE
jgi:hypothetical protein